MRRRLMLKSSAGVSPVLPTEYQRVEWIGKENTQAAILDSGIFLSDCVLNLIASVSNYIVGLNGASGLISGDVSIFFGGPNYGNKYGITALGGGSYINTMPNYVPGLNVFCELEINMSTKLFRVENASVNFNTGSATPTGKLTFFNPYYGGYFKIKEAQLTNTGGVLVRNYVPVYRKADNEIGIYDTVSQTFLTNIGSGAFTKGADVN